MVARSFSLLLLSTVAGLAFRVPLAAAGPTALRLGTPDEVALLTRALEKTASDMLRWAYTESRLIRDEKGRVKSNVELRYDPSRPYAEQWTPLTVDGKPPSAGDREKYRRQGERAGRREARGESSRRYSLGELLQLGGARVAAEDGRQLVFEVPLRRDGNNRFPPEKFEVLVTIDRAAVTLERIALRLRESFRSNLVIKVKSGDGTLGFSAVDAEHPPTLTEIRGDASVSVLFVSVGGELDLKRTDFKRVTPYGERFEVTIGALKAIDF